MARPWQDAELPMAEVPPSSRAAASTHRLPTIAASQALRNINSSDLHAVSLGLPTLDALLQSRRKTFSDASKVVGAGLSRTQIAEIYGPPGSGKTMMSTQAAVSALKVGDHVVWIGGTSSSVLVSRATDLSDCAARLSGARLKQVVAAADPPLHDMNDALSKFHHLSCPTLAHLLALTVHGPPSFPPSNTSLIVVESLASLLDLAYPRRLDDRSENGKWVSSRRQAAIGEFSRALARLAAIQNLAVIVTANATTKLRGDAAAILRSPIINFEWDNAVAQRIVLFQDWAEDAGDGQATLSKPSARFASLAKSVTQAFPTNHSHSNLVAFDITLGGLSELPMVQRKLNTGQSVEIGGVKRPFTDLEQGQTEQESGDEYGWVEDDDQLTAEGLVDESALVSGLT